MAKNDAVAVVKKPMTAAQRKAAQRARESRSDKLTADTSRKQLNVTVSVATSSDLAKIVKATSLNQGEVVSRLIRAANFQMEWLRQSVDGMDVPSDADYSKNFIDAWQGQPHYSNNKSPIESRNPRDLRKALQDEWYLEDLKKRGVLPKDEV